MTHGEIVERILRYYPPLSMPDSCDGIKFGDPHDECTGIAVCCSPTLEVIRKAAAAGYNFLYAHEPLFWDHMDAAGRLPDNPIKTVKEQLLSENHMMVFRDHDRLHADNGCTDWVIKGWERLLGWGKYRVANDAGVYLGQVYDIPETTLEELSREILTRTDYPATRIIGRRTNKIRRVWMCVHIIPSPIFSGDRIIEDIESCHIDAILPLDTIDWSALAYIRDADMAGRELSALLLGHFNLESAAIGYMVEDIPRMIGNSSLPVTHIPDGPMYDYIVR